jgi:hypothetical protein
MIGQPEVVEAQALYAESDQKYRLVRPIVFWEVVKNTHHATGFPQLRIKVTYPGGRTRMVAGAFDDRFAMERYIGRWLPALAGKEKASL